VLTYFDENLIKLKTKFFLILQFNFFFFNLQEKRNRAKTDSGNLVEYTIMWYNNFEGTRQIESVTSE